jgi:tRNA pseudouridine55 synthase
MSAEDLDGVLVVDKPAGPTSHDMVNRARRIFRLRRIGHTGTLDPFATGVLPLCLGRATRLARFLGGGEKIYRASVRVGFATSTDDLTGEPLSETKELHLDAGDVRQALNEFVGTHDQMPPAYSARKVGGRRSYDLARKGEAVPRTARPATIHAIELLGIEGARIEIEVRCARGTYIRSVARDLGEALGVGAHLTALRRTRSGSFVLEQAVTGDDLALGRDRVVSLADALPELPAVRVGPEGRDLVRHGRFLGREDVVDGFPDGPVERVRILDEPGVLLALAVPRGSDSGEAPVVETTLHPDVVLVA